jgi:signal transduction histidine kinase
MTRLVQTGEDVLEGDARRIAAELHDGAMQEITLARLQLDLLCAGLADDPALSKQLAELSDVLQDASVRLQELMRALAGGAGIV